MALIPVVAVAVRTLDSRAPIVLPNPPAPSVLRDAFRKTTRNDMSIGSLGMRW